MRAAYLAATLLLVHFSVRAQLQSLEVFSPATTGGNYGHVNFYDPSLVGQKNTSVVRYADIEGTPYWNEKWNPAYLFLRSGSVVKLKNVKLNLFSGDVTYLDSNGTEMDAIPGIIRRVMFMSASDTAKILSVFEAFPDSKVENGYTYYKILSDGKWKLLELQKSFVRTVPLDAMASKKTESSFFLKMSYAIADENNVSPLKSLTHDNITTVIHPDNSTEQWLKDHKNSLKRESDVIDFLQYYNSRNK